MTSATRWTPGQPPTPVTPPDTEGEGVLWVDSSDDADAEELYASLGPKMPGLERGMLDDLLQPDHYPQGRRYDAGRVRLVSTFRVEPRDGADHPHRDVFPGPVDLMIQPVEILAGEGW